MSQYLPKLLSMKWEPSFQLELLYQVFCCLGIKYHDVFQARLLWIPMPLWWMAFLAGASDTCAYSQVFQQLFTETRGYDYDKCK